MIRFVRVVVLAACAAGVMGCGGGGGDGKTALRFDVALRANVPQSVVDSVSFIRIKLTAGAATDMRDVPVLEELKSDRDTSFRYVDDGRFADKDVSIEIEVRSNTMKLFGGADTIHFNPEETVEIAFTFGDMVPDGGTGCTPTPTCTADAAKVCIQGTVVDFGMGQTLTNRQVGVTVKLSSGAVPIANLPINPCGQFATGSFQLSIAAGDDVELVVDDLNAITDFVPTVTPFRVAAGDVVTGATLRAMASEQNRGLSEQAGLCTAPCPETMTMAARGAVALFYKKNGQPTSNVRMTRGTNPGVPPSLVTTDVFYFVDVTAGRQTVVSTTQTATSPSGAAIALIPGASALAYGGTGAVGNDAVWVPQVVNGRVGSVVVIDAITTRGDKCNPETQMGCTNRDDGCYPIPNSTNVFCAHEGNLALNTNCTAFEECASGTTCDLTGSVCHRICGPTTSCPSPTTCAQIMNGQLGVCR